MFVNIHTAEFMSLVLLTDDDEFSVTSIGRESGATLPNLPQLQQPSTSGVDMLVEADHSEDSVPVNMDNLQEILTAATASLAGKCVCNWFSYMANIRYKFNNHCIVGYICNMS